MIPFYAEVCQGAGRLVCLGWSLAVAVGNWAVASWGVEGRGSMGSGKKDKRVSGAEKVWKIKIIKISIKENYV